MCGFSGFIARSAFPVNPVELLQSMGAAIQHRGPDDGGIWFDPATGIGLSHRRLSVLELSPAGHQPMTSHCGRYVIAFNGEIYNHLSLRSLLEQTESAPKWKGHSDTETLLACFVAWGVEKTLQSAVGMFAIALWDKQANELTLARDRVGEKPLYWGWQEGVLLFGSELKALKAHPACKGEVDRNALTLLLRYNYIPAPFSIYKYIQKLSAGHYICFNLNDIDLSTVQAKPYWQMNHAIEHGLANPFTNEKQAIDALEEQLTASIGEQMLADVPLGAFLSGGIDSSTIVALMQKQSSIPVKTFTIGFNEQGFNEAEHALAVARYLGTEHTECYVDATDALAIIPRLAQIYCEPFADSSQIPTFLVSQMARQHVTVALSGDAGDELFGGYNPYQFAPRIWGYLNKLPVSMRKLAASLLAGMPAPDKARRFIEILPAVNREEFYRLLVSHWTRPDLLIVDSMEPATLLNTRSAWPSTESFAHWMMSMDSQTYMTDDILVKVDRAAMANSLEVRVPMLDHRVIELAWRIPMDMKIRDGKGKQVLREVLYRHVPQALIERPKKGFSIPLAQWLRGPLREWGEALLDEKRLQSEGYFHAAPIRKVWQDHLHGRADYSTKLWGVLMFQAWLVEQKK